MMFIKLNNIIMVLFLAFTWGQTVDWDSDIVKTSLLSYKAELVSDGYVLPWGMSFLPDGDLIVSDISGKIYQIKNGINKKVSITEPLIEEAERIETQIKAMIAHQLGSQGTSDEDGDGPNAMLYG